MANIKEMPRQESPERAEEKRVYDTLLPDLITLGGFEKHEIKVTFIRENLFAVGTEKNISFYCDKRGVPLFNIGHIRQGIFFRKVLSAGRYTETKNDRGEYKLSRIFRNSATKKEDPPEELSLYSEEYYMAWEDLLLYTERFMLDIFHRKDGSWVYHSPTPETMENVARMWNLRAIDLIKFLENKQITREMYDRLIGKTVRDLREQSDDIRLNRIDANVTKEEVRIYLDKKLIDKATYSMYLKVIDHRDEVLGNTRLDRLKAKKESLLKRMGLREDMQ